MALKLSQVLDLAIGVDNASVNLLHLREVLITVITTLDIGHVTVKDCGGEIEKSDGSEVHLNDHTLPQDRTQDDTSTDQDQRNEGLETDENENDTVYIENENEDEGNEIDARHLETNENSEKHETQTSNVQTTDPAERKRSESVVSKVSNVSMHAQNSTLSSKVFLLEENLKRLQNIVGSLISQVDGNNNVDLSSLLGQLEKNTGDPKTSLADISRHSSTSMRFGHEQVGGSELDSGDVLAQSSLKRPVTQPALASANRKPEIPRSKTASHVMRKGKKLIRQGSMPLKLKPRQFVPTIPEEVQQGEHGIKRVTGDKQYIQGERGIEEVTEDMQGTQGEVWIGDDVSKEIQPNEEYLQSDSDSEGDIEEIIEREIEAALSDPSDPQNTAHALRLGLEQMKRWREEFQMVQENVRLEVEACRNYIQSLDGHLNALKGEKKNQETEQFNALHNVHRQIIDLEQKQTKLSKTVNELVDEYNRHETTFSDMMNSIDKLDEQKVDKVLLSTQVNDKANKAELRDKVSVSMFDESFSLLDQALNDALEKMSNQMSVEEALRETLNEMQSGMEMKLNREDMENLKEELEARIKEVRAAQEKGLIGKNEIPKDPAGFKRFIEKVRCISCDRDVEIEPSHAHSLPSLPKTQPLAGIPRSRDVHMKKTADDERRLSKVKSEVIMGGGLQDLFPMSQRFCGGRHTVTRKNKRFMGPTLNDYIMIRESDHVSLPPREFIVSKDSGLRRMMKQKLPAINDLKHLPGIREERNSLKDSDEYDIAGNADETNYAN